MIPLSQRVAGTTATDYEIISRRLDQYDFHLHCCAPGTIVDYDLATQTVSVQLAVKDVVPVMTQGGEEITTKKIPILSKVPIIMPRAGGFAITFPIQIGDECLVFFADSGIDNWWQSGTEETNEYTVEPMSVRRHDLSDGFAILGPWSQPNIIGAEGTSYNETDLEIRNETGTISIAVSEIDGITVTHTDTITLDASEVEINGVQTLSPSKGSTTTIQVLDNSLVLSVGSSTLTITSDKIALIASEITLNGKDFMPHRHTDGTGTTAPYVGDTGPVL